MSPSPEPQSTDTADTTATTETPYIFPSINLPKLLSGETYTYHTPVPQAILDNPTEPVILGVDEAGRGPVLGPMVYAAAYCHKSYSDEIKRLGYADSKKMTATTRHTLFKTLCTPPAASTDTNSPPAHHLGFSITAISPLTISTGMQRPPHHGSYNLNTLAHDTTIALIRSIQTSVPSLSEVYIDTVGPPHTYQAKLALLFPTLKIVVEKQADGIYPVVSAASVCAKVTRDEALEAMIRVDNSSTTSGEGQQEQEQVLGSGYPGDAKTIAYLKRNIDPVFGWRGEIVRFSWATARDLLDKDPAAVKVEWAEPAEEGGQQIVGFLSGGGGPAGPGGKFEGVAGWYGRGVDPEVDF